MMLSRACEYAVKIMVYVASQKESRDRISLDEITEAIDSPRAFTAKILQQLVRGDLLVSSKGPKGGFRLVENKPIMLFDIVNAIDGDQLLTKCLIGLKTCSDANPCPVHHKFGEVRTQLTEIMNTCEITGESLLNRNYTLV